jgi:hypothetical protein
MRKRVDRGVVYVVYVVYVNAVEGERKCHE